MKSKLIVGNWKLNPLTLKEAQELTAKIDIVSLNTVVICPPMAFVGSVKYAHLGSQDVSAQVKGAYTGQISAAQLKSLANIEYCIVGHSERRQFAGETDADVNMKVKSLLQYGITPIICVGFGTTVEEDELEVMDIVKEQVSAALKDVDLAAASSTSSNTSSSNTSTSSSTSSSCKIVIAYEPMWAIGSKSAASPEHADQVALFIKTKFPGVEVLYGGSVNSTNAASFIDDSVAGASNSHIDGLLIGGASLLADDFNKIIALGR
jgi:triosephosphate isomerase (TIM)